MSDTTHGAAAANETGSPPRHRSALIAGVLAASLIVAGTGAGVWGRVAATAEPAGGAMDAAQQLVDAGYPAALVSETGADGGGDEVAAGEADLADGTEARPDTEVRIGSNTKTLVAVIVLQLVEEGRLGLDDAIETHLPGIVRGEGIDGGAITVRQLLQHTAGLPEYVEAVAEDPFAVRDVYRSPRDVLDGALTQGAAFAPGERWSYSNSNYLVLGLLIERVTQRPLPEAVDERIAERLGLEHTYLPVAGERELRGEHPRGYHVDAERVLQDVTVVDPSWAWSAGAAVSTPSELNEVMRAVLDGRLLGADMLREMQTAVPADEELWPGSAYGLGLQKYPLSCGIDAWGHGGDIPGYQTRNAATADGAAVTIAVTALPWAVVDPADEEALLAQYRIVLDALDERLCAVAAPE